MLWSHRRELCTGFRFGHCMMPKPQIAALPAGTRWRGVDLQRRVDTGDAFERP
jgi:hypothetical protein